MSLPVLEQQWTYNNNGNSYDKVERQVIEDARVFPATVVSVEQTMSDGKTTTDGRAV